MSGTAISIIVYGAYYALAGLTYLLMPDLVVSLSGLPAEGTLYLRMAGVLMGVVGYFYIQAARQDLRAFFRWTVHARIAACALFIALVAAGVAPPLVALFGVLDLIGAGWTWLTLRPSG
jgi:hypothetical protein